MYLDLPSRGDAFTSLLGKVDRISVTGSIWWYTRRTEHRIVLFAPDDEKERPHAVTIGAGILKSPVCSTLRVGLANIHLLLCIRLWSMFCAISAFVLTVLRMLQWCS